MNEFSLECFIAVADLGSFTKAAIRVNRTQSAVTQQIGNLERKLETLLFHREKKVTLTKQGELFLPYALRIHGLYQEVVDRFKNPELDGEVRIGVPEDFATLFLALFFALLFFAATSTPLKVYLLCPKVTPAPPKMA